jgi:peroxiredoxin Q/BCP
MAQLRQDYDQFLERDTTVLVIGPENAKQFTKFFAENDLPFPGLPDSNHSVLKLYGQEVKIFKFGRMPAQALVDKSGILRYVHYGKSMSDIPTDQELLDVIDEINRNELVTGASKRNN